MGVEDNVELDELRNRCEAAEQKIALLQTQVRELVGWKAEVELELTQIRSSPIFSGIPTR
jgi:hypothetical protein